MWLYSLSLYRCAILPFILAGSRERKRGKSETKGATPVDEMVGLATLNY